MHHQQSPPRLPPPTKLLGVVDTLWHEVAEALPDLEAIAEGGAQDDDDHMGELYDEATKKTRVFFYLEEPKQALRLALESGEEHFNVLSPSATDGSYVERLVNAAIGEYVARKQKEFDGAAEDAAEGETKEEEESLDMAKLQNVVHLMFQRCYAMVTFWEWHSKPGRAIR